MDREQSWRVIEQERLRLADVLDTLTDEEWLRPSLCAGWRVRDVVAHMVLVPRAPSLGKLLLSVVRARGDLNRASTRMSIGYAESRSTAELAAEFRTHAGSRRTPKVTTYQNILYDTLVHAQDIAIPLGRNLPMPVEPARAAADRVWTMDMAFHARRKFAGFALRATDTDWSRGDGPREVRGPMEAVLLLITGRRVALPRLSGPGVADLTP